jgi:hypothetical protein
MEHAPHQAIAPAEFAIALPDPVLRSIVTSLATSDAIGTPSRYNARFPASAAIFGPGIRKPARLSGSAPETAIQVPVSPRRRVSRKKPMASGSANCSPENPATKRPPRISPRRSSLVCRNSLCPDCSSTVSCQSFRHVLRFKCQRRFAVRQYRKYLRDNERHHFTFVLSRISANLHFLSEQVPAESRNPPKRFRAGGRAIAERKISVPRSGKDRNARLRKIHAMREGGAHR